MADASNNEVIGFIASTVETMRDDLTSVRTQMVTKDTFEAAIVAVRGDIEQVQLRLDSMEHSLPQDSNMSKAS